MPTASHHINHHVRNDGNASGDGFRCVEVITGVRCRRDWSVDDKLAIVAESFATRTSISDVARRHGLNRNQLFQWRAQFREGKLGEPAAIGEFVPVEVSATDRLLAPPAERGTKGETGLGGAVIELVVGSVTVRVPPGADEATLRRVVGVVKALA